MSEPVGGQSRNLGTGCKQNIPGLGCTRGSEKLQLWSSQPLAPSGDSWGPADLCGTPHCIPNRGAHRAKRLLPTLCGSWGGVITEAPGAALPQSLWHRRHGPVPPQDNDRVDTVKSFTVIPSGR